MFNKFFLVGIVVSLFLNYGSVKTYSIHYEGATFIVSSADPATEDYRRDSKKKYAGEVQPSENTKRYVGDDKKDSTENRKRRGTEKRYIGDEEDAETFFIEEKKALGIEEPSDKE